MGLKEKIIIVVINHILENRKDKIVMNDEGLRFLEGLVRTELRDFCASDFNLFIERGIEEMPSVGVSFRRRNEIL